MVEACVGGKNLGWMVWKKEADLEYSAELMYMRFNTRGDSPLVLTAQCHAHVQDGCRQWDQLHLKPWGATKSAPTSTPSNFTVHEPLLPLTLDLFFYQFRGGGWGEIMFSTHTNHFLPAFTPIFHFHSVVTLSIYRGDIFPAGVVYNSSSLLAYFFPPMEFHESTCELHEMALGLVPVWPSLISWYLRDKKKLRKLFSRHIVI